MIISACCKPHKPLPISESTAELTCGSTNRAITKRSSSEFVNASSTYSYEMISIDK